MKQPDYTVTSHDIFGHAYQVSTRDLTWRPAAYAVIVRDNQILLMHHENGYHLPGGGVNLGELPEQAVVREVKEETGLVASGPQLINLASSFFTWHELGNGNLHHHHSILLYFALTYESGALSSAGHDEYEQADGVTPQWLPLEKLNSVKIGSTVDWRPLIKVKLPNEIA